MAPGKEPGLFDLIIINDDLNQAYSKLKEILAEVSVLAFWSNSSLVYMIEKHPVDR